MSLLETFSRELVFSEYGDLFASDDESNDGIDGVGELNGLPSLDLSAAVANSTCGSEEMSRGVNPSVETSVCKVRGISGDRRGLVSGAGN